MLHVHVAQQEAEIHLGVVEVTNQRREREEEERDRDEYLCDRLAENRCHRILHEGSARHATVLANARRKNNERREGADDHRVDEDGQHLNEALLGRM